MNQNAAISSYYDRQRIILNTLAQYIMPASTIDVKDTSNPDGLIDLVSVLPDPSSYVGDNVNIDISFADKYIYNSGLALLAAWRKRLGSDVIVSVKDSRCKETARRVLTNSGLRTILEQNSETPLYSGNPHSKVPLQPIVPGFSTEKAINRVYKMFDDYAGYIRDTKPFRIILSEIVENSLVHGEIETPGYICAALHHPSSGDKCEITIVDTGIGVHASYIEGSNEDIKRRISSGASPLEIALDGLSSSKPQASTPSGRSHFGFGLYTVRRLVELNRGRLTLLSGSEAVTIDRFGKKRIALKSSWHGTIVSILLDMGNPLPLEDVYEEEVTRILPDPSARASKLTQNTPPKECPQQSTPSEATQGIAVLKLADFGAELLARDTGLAIRAELATLLSDGSRITVDLDGVDDVTPSVADECFGKLAERLGEAKFRQRISFTGGTPLMHRLIDFVLAQRIKSKT